MDGCPANNLHYRPSAFDQQFAGCGASCRAQAQCCYARARAHHGSIMVATCKTTARLPWRSAEGAGDVMRDEVKLRLEGEA